MVHPPIKASYILPIRREQIEPTEELAAYLRWLAGLVEVIVVDGSPAPVFAAHAAAWGEMVQHIAPAPEFAARNGKVQGVLTGLRVARHERVVIADDDVFYDAPALARVVALLDDATVVRPQNYFEPLPWHALWDTSRTLLNRISGGDWPGTLAVQRSCLQATGGYAGDVLFENLELVRTVRAAGGREVVPLDLFVRRAPASTRHFWSQRVRQAYDEFARPVRCIVSLAVLPLVLTLMHTRRWHTLLAGAGALIGLAEFGRWRGGGRHVFPVTAALLTPAWVIERAVCIWLALGSRVLIGGVRYRGGVLRDAATPLRELRRRHQAGRADRAGRGSTRRCASVAAHWSSGLAGTAAASERRQHGAVPAVLSRDRGTALASQRDDCKTPPNESARAGTSQHAASVIDDVSISLRSVVSPSNPKREVEQVACRP